MYKDTKEKSQKIHQLFEEGVILTKICEITSSSQFTVKKVLSSFGIDYDSYMKEEYRKKLNRVVELYREGKPQLFIEKELNLTRKTIRNLLKNQEDMVYKTKSDQWLLRYGGTLNEECFNELTPESLYWIGMLYADGHITKSREFSIELVLHKDDHLHLEKYKNFLGTSRNIGKGTGNGLRVRINSKKIHNRLSELGFKHDKSYTAIPHDSFKESRDFWRGAVDGDGGVYRYTRIDQVFLCGTLETIFDFIVFCSKHAGVKEKYPSKASGVVLYQVSYYGQDARKVATLLYKDACVYLERKYQKYLEIVNN